MAYLIWLILLSVLGEPGFAGDLQLALVGFVLGLVKLPGLVSLRVLHINTNRDSCMNLYIGLDK